MAGLATGMDSTLPSLSTELITTNVFGTTWNVSQHNMATDAFFHHRSSAGRAIAKMAGVGCWMATRLRH